jgi:CO dehydrogenase/acetyl-CoA synthase epsilon subunit
MSVKSLPIISLSLLLALSGCSSSDENLVDPKTNMAVFFCPMLKDIVEDANDKVWTLGQRTSIQELLESLLEVSEKSRTIAVVSGPPAADWLNQLAQSSFDFIVYFSGTGYVDSSQLMEIASRWKSNYEQLNTYCS